MSSLMIGISGVRGIVGESLTPELLTRLGSAFGTYLMGGNIHHIASAIKNLIGDLAGVICDGAKNSCALKLATAAGTAVQSALFALHGLQVEARDGIIAASAEDTMKNIGKLSLHGMIEADRTILQIMIDKQFSD